jgi:hypothetical protein
MKASDLILLLQECVDKGHDLDVHSTADYDVVNGVEVCPVGTVTQAIYEDTFPDGFINLEGGREPNFHLKFDPTPEEDKRQTDENRARLKAKGYKLLDI